MNVKRLKTKECLVYWAKNGSIAKIEINLKDVDPKNIDTTSEETIHYLLELC
jgi:hypothetical protein